MICDRCFQPDDQGEHGVGLCPYEPRKAAAGVIDDQIPGGPRMFENLSKNPIYIETRSQLKRECEKNGVKPLVRHVGTKDGDRSPHTTRWI